VLSVNVGYIVVISQSTRHLRGISSKIFLKKSPEYSSGCLYSSVVEIRRKAILDLGVALFRKLKVSLVEVI
jgi:hypothetical protein